MNDRDSESARKDRAQPSADSAAMIFPPAPPSRFDYWLTSGPTAESRALQAVASFQRRLHDGKPFEPALVLAYELTKSLHLLGYDSRIVEAVGRISVRSGDTERLAALLGTGGQQAAVPATDPMKRHYLVWVPGAKRLVDLTAFTRPEFYRHLRERPELTWPMILGTSLDTLPEQQFPLMGAPRDEFVVQYVVDPSAVVPLALIDDDLRLMTTTQERVFRIAYAAGSALNLFAITDAGDIALSDGFFTIFGDLESAKDAFSRLSFED